jgi:hypothetical protein
MITAVAIDRLDLDHQAFEQLRVTRCHLFLRTLFHLAAASITTSRKIYARASSHRPGMPNPIASASPIAHRGIWVEPTLLAEIEYRAKSAEGKVRHPVFKGLREDL